MARVIAHNMFDKANARFGELSQEAIWSNAMAMFLRHSARGWLGTRPTSTTSGFRGHPASPPMSCPATVTTTVSARQAWSSSSAFTRMAGAVAAGVLAGAWCERKMAPGSTGAACRSKLDRRNRPEQCGGRWRWMNWHARGEDANLVSRKRRCSTQWRPATICGGRD